MGESGGRGGEGGGDRVPSANAAGLAGEDEERGLKRILGVRTIAEQTSTNVHDHRLVASDQFRERRGVAVDREACEEVAIGAGRAGGIQGPMQVMNDRVER